MTAKTPLERVAFSPGEFATLFGKSQTWGYRQIYAGKVKAITQHGRILIPAAEVDAILKTAGIYDGLKPKAAKTKAQIQSLAPRLQTAWRSFLAARRENSASGKAPMGAAAQKQKWPVSEAGRKAALARLTGAKRNGR
jgi:hypothetical protein